MSHMGNSGRLAIVAAIAAAGLLVLTAITLEESVLFTFLGTVALGYLACVIQVVARGRNLALLAGGVGTSLFIGFAIAFLRMWGLAFTAEPDALGAAVTTQDSDIYFYLAALSGAGTLLVLFAGAVWPAGKRLRRSQTAGTAYGRGQASKSGAVRAPAKRPSSSTAKTPAARVARPVSKSAAPKSAAPKSAPKRAAKPSPASPAKAASRR